MAAGAKVFAIVGQESVKCWDAAAAAAASTVAHRMIGNAAKWEQTREER